jgi:DNA-directed RNA polymerase subunit beta'
MVEAGDVIVKIPRETTKTKDITGGLPRVAELFEARKPKEYALISDIDGMVEFGKDLKGKRKVVIRPDVGEPKEYMIPRGKHVSVHEGDFVKAGEALMDGPSNPHDILRVLGDKALARYLVDEIQEVYKPPEFHPLNIEPEPYPPTLSKYHEDWKDHPSRPPLL